MKIHYPSRSLWGAATVPAEYAITTVTMMTMNRNQDSLTQDLQINATSG